MWSSNKMHFLWFIFNLHLVMKMLAPVLLCMLMCLLQPLYLKKQNKKTFVF